VREPGGLAQSPSADRFRRPVVILSGKARAAAPSFDESTLLSARASKKWIR
jgi:hypothetical protein